MKTFIQLQNTHATELPGELGGDDVRYTDSLVTHFLHEFTAPGAVVFDPFAGFGTTHDDPTTVADSGTARATPSRNPAAQRDTPPAAAGHTGTAPQRDSSAAATPNTGATRAAA